MKFYFMYFLNICFVMKFYINVLLSSFILVFVIFFLFLSMSKFFDY